MQERRILRQKLSTLSLAGAKAPALNSSVVHAAPAKSSRMISVIIPAHNEEDYLGATLEALRRQDHKWFELIVVANGCTDATVKVARGYCHRLIVLSQKGLGLARNLGARMAAGELLMFLDADTTLQPGALGRIARNFDLTNAAGTLKGVPDPSPPVYRLIYALKNLVHWSGLHPGSSGVILCWRKHFFDVGGFDERLEVRENSDLIKRLQRLGRYRYFGDITASTSMRRYQQRGVSRVAWLWFKVWLESLRGDLRQRRYETVR
jgi:glycosyltransferase involved in cell wall biosynthesis